MAKRKPPEPGAINKNGQLLVRRTDDQGSHRYSKIWILRCSEPDCELEYEANGRDFHIRRRPNYGGRPP